MRLSAILIPFFVVGAIGLTTACSANPSTQQPVTVAPSSLNFDATRFEARQLKVGGKTVAVRAYENIVYVAKPVDMTTQIMNIYVPETYFHGGSVGAYTAQTAPIFLPNYVGGYMPGQSGTLDGSRMPGPPDRPNTITLALARGYVVATPGARGRISKSAEGLYIGKAPAAIVDLKAAVRYLRFNDARMPGDAEKIISNGTSAGGALSALLGASGDSADYEADLKALGAAPARDDIFAVSAYCPIANLEQADAAYEWQFNGIHEYKKIDFSMLDYKVQRKEIAGTMTAAQISLSNELKSLFPAYVNGLKLHGQGGELLSLDATGNGSFKDYVKSLVIASAQKALDQGQNLSAHAWLRIEGRTVRDLDFDRYLRYLERQKVPPAFDGVDLSTGENQLFGNERIDKRHFTEFAVSHDTATGAGRADERIVGMMNPMNYIGAPGAKNAKYWRIRHGAKDKDTSLAIPALLALALRNQNTAVDFALPWERPHSGDYDLDELFAWMEKISAVSDTKQNLRNP
jgi:hypothetical protein